MERKTQAVLILYTQAYRYCVFQLRNSKQYSLIQNDCSEYHDNFCPFLSIARHIVTRIHPQFSFESLHRVTLNTIPTFKEGNFRIEDHYSYTFVYNQWYHMLTESLQYDGFSNETAVYMQQIYDEEAFVENMSTLGINYQLISQDQLLQLNPNLIDAFTLSLFASTNLETQIKQQLQLKASPPSKDNTFIFIQHNRGDFIDKLRKGHTPMPTKAFYYGIYKKDHQQWYTFNVAHNEYPSQELLAHTKAIIMPGSSSSAYDNDDWIRNYRNWLFHVYSNYPNLQILGICFGEQILAHTLNGKCEGVLERKKDPHFYNTGTQKLLMNAEFLEIPFVKKLNLKKNALQIIKMHGDIVVKLDEKKFEVVGSSENYEIEVFVDKRDNPLQNPRILCFQGHPEYSNEWVSMRDIQYYSLYHNMSSQEAQKKARYGYHTPDDNQILRAICQQFLLSDSSSQQNVNLQKNIIKKQ